MGAQRMEENIRTTISRAFRDAARWQTITTMFLVFTAWMLAGMHAAVSVFVGGLSVLIGGYVGVATIRHRGGLTPGAVLMTLLKAEIIRITVISLLLLAAFKFYKGLVPLALIGGLAAAVLISGAGLRTLGNDINKQVF